VPKWLNELHAKVAMPVGSSGAAPNFQLAEGSAN
jgi:hypothetical protein